MTSTAKRYSSHGKDRTDFYTVAAWIENLFPFYNRTGTFHADTPYSTNTGRLTGKLADQFKGGVLTGEIDYAVWSYSTPIAWHKTDGTWVETGEHYSNATTRHQGVISTALSVLYPVER